MKARYNKISNSFRKDIRAKVEEEFKKQSNDMTLRHFKLFCVSLHQEFGFGKKEAHATHRQGREHSTRKGYGRGVLESR